MRLYEAVFIARQEITPAQVETMTQGFISTIKSFGGEVTKTEFCGLRPLAYPIKKSTKGHYVLMNISVEPKGINEMERQMKLNEDVLRILTVKVEKLDPNPSHLMQQKTFVGRPSYSQDDSFEDFSADALETNDSLSADGEAKETTI